ncbi:hypothetical protein CAPTEDRAFT_181820 [Capitella teleta]|uniref:Vesicle-associated membrane protein 7 n=1 Tax=Capitella teleta TaxID=283909 RepID=R7UP92_CAPTE|nr:hypothetical protein CAPTEDRAFT_181820 [Capitella teleta]|eukprot:ELU08344.1 hypothetical protein CAPTEDRAFT_181820 [Capitella teleta]
MTILYSVISRGPTVLCSHASGSGNYHEVVKSMLPNIPTASDAKTTYTSNNYMFHVMVDSGIIYMCASDPEFGRRVPYAFLNEIKDQFYSGSLASRSQFAEENELDRDFSPVLANQMERFSRTDGASGDNLTVLQSQVEEVKGVMTQNIEKVLERGERLDDLMDKTTDLEASSLTFKKTARTVQRKMFWKNRKMTIILVCVALVIITIIILIILFSTKVLPPKSGGGGSDPTTTTTTTAAPPALGFR